MRIDSINNKNFEAKKILSVSPKCLKQDAIKYPFAPQTKDVVTMEIVKIDKNEDLDFIIRYYKSLLNIINNSQNKNEKIYIISFANFLKEIIANALNPAKNFYMGVMKNIGIISGFNIDTKHLDQPKQNSNFKIAVKDNAINVISDVITEFSTFNELLKQNVVKNLEMFDSIDGNKYFYPNIKASKDYTRQAWDKIMNIKETSKNIPLGEYLASLTNE